MEACIYAWPSGKFELQMLKDLISRGVIAV